MIKRFSAFFILAMCVCSSVFGWTKIGHDAIAYIAECHLTPKAKANIEKYLDGHSIVYYASWMDKVRMTPEYKHTTKWHSTAVNDEGKYRHDMKHGDVVSAIDDAIGRLQNRGEMSDSAVAVDIKILVHAIGDMHCPAHSKFPKHPQGEIKFNLNGNEAQFHSFWDAAPDNCHRWYYVDYQYQLDRNDDAMREELSKGTPRQWAEECAAENRTVYDWLTPGAKFDKTQTLDVFLKAEALVDSRIPKAGYRLARVLNELFDK